MLANCTHLTCPYVEEAFWLKLFVPRSLTHQFTPTPAPLLRWPSRRVAAWRPDRLSAPRMTISGRSSMARATRSRIASQALGPQQYRQQIPPHHPKPLGGGSPGKPKVPTSFQTLDSPGQTAGQGDSSVNLSRKEKLLAMLCEKTMCYVKSSPPCIIFRLPMPPI